MFSLLRKLFLALRKVGIVKITPQVPFVRLKISPPPPLAHLSKISDPHPPTPFTTIWKTQAVISVDAYPFWLSRT